MYFLIRRKIEVVPLPLAPSPAHALTRNRTENARRVCDAPRTLALWHLASLDAPTVAIVWSLAFAWTAHIYLPKWVPLLLALVTWAVYVFDRLLDARSGQREPTRHKLRERHYFHWRYRRALLPMAIAAACAAAGIILTFMPPVACEHDSVLAAAAFAYFSGVHTGCKARQFRLPWPHAIPGKEFLVGVLFTAGCVLPAWHRPPAFAASESATWAFWIPAMVFAALAWLNCSCIARWESIDEFRNTNSPDAKGTFRVRRSERPTIFIAGILLACGGLLLAAACASVHPRPAALLAAAAVSASLLALLDRMQSRFSPLALRAGADLVLLMPLLLIPLAGLLG